MNCPNCNSFKVKHAENHFRCQQCGHSWYISREALRMPQIRNLAYSPPPRFNTRLFYCHNHQDKANAYVKALEKAGYHQVEAPDRRTAFMLTDSDVSGRARQIHNFYQVTHGGRVYMYPHTATPMWLWDGIYIPSPYITAVFGIGEGSAEVPKRYGFDKPIHPVGWTYTRLRKFKSCKHPRKVLFAPIHANGNGYLSPEQTLINGQTFDRLVPLAQTGQIELTVRYLHKLEWNGIERVQGVEYVKGEPDQSIAEIDRADIVVTKQNMQYMSVARGVPTVGMGEEATPVNATSAKNLMHVVSWQRYRDYMRFPIDLLDTSNPNDAMDMLRQAAACDVSIADWRTRMIGDAFDGKKFVEILEGYL
jgi:hypothetical protein